MHHLEFLTSPSDQDIWMNPIVRPDDRFNYYAYFLIYVYDVMVIYIDSEILLRRVDKYFNLKPSSIGYPKIYLGVKSNKMRLKNRVWELANSPARYFKELVANIENYLVELSDAR